MAGRLTASRLVRQVARKPAGSGRSFCTANTTPDAKSESLNKRLSGRGGFWVGLFGSLGLYYYAGKRAREDKEWRASLPRELGDSLVAGIDTLDSIEFSNPLGWLHRCRHSKGESTAGADGTTPMYCKSQSGVLSPVATEAMFLTIKLKRSANFAECATLAAKALSQEEEKELSAALGFSERVWNNVQSKLPAGIPLHPFEYHARKGAHGRLPATGGDIFLHVKGDRGTSFSIARKVLESLPMEAIYDAEDVYGFRYGDDKDLLDYNICGSSNDGIPVSDKSRVAVVPTTGGSYALAQLWRHRIYDFAELSEEEQDVVVGKTKEGKFLCSDVIDLKDRPSQLAMAIEHGFPEASHVARVTGVDQDCHQLSMVRQSMCIGNVAPGPVGKDNIHEPGLFFLAYANDPMVFGYMLERMVGSPIRGSPKEKRPNDQLMQYSTCLRGQLYYIPSQEQLASLANLL